MSEQVVYLVVRLNWDVHETLSVWTTREAAESEAGRFRQKEAYGAVYEIDELPLDEPFPSDDVNDPRPKGADL